MLRNKLRNNMKHTRKLTKLGKRSLGVVLPAEEVRTLGWKARQKLIVKRVPRGFMILDALTKKRKK